MFNFLKKKKVEEYLEVSKHKPFVWKLSWSQNIAEQSGFYTKWSSITVSKMFYTQEDIAAFILKYNIYDNIKKEKLTDYWI